MTKKLLTLICLLTFTLIQAQIKGRITDTSNNPIPYASIIQQNTYNGTSSNENGFYDLTVPKNGDITIVYKSIGYKTVTKTIQINQLPYTLNIVLQDEDNQLEEMVIKTRKEDPAYEIIRNTLAVKKSIQNKIKGYEVDFYSKGAFILDSVPNKVFLFDTKELKEDMDSTKSKYIYLSETFSKLKYEKPNKYNEVITASRISGDSNGYSFNTGLQSNIDFYNNNISQISNAVSPLSSSTFAYYRFKLVNTFIDEHNQLINKIQVTSKNTSEPTFTGHIYIVENSWEIYAIDLSIKGKSVKQQFMDEIYVQQQFQYNPTQKIWTKQTQGLQIKASLFGFKLIGNFMYVLKNYNINPDFKKSDFSKTIVEIKDQANKKDSLFWAQNRPIALSEDEAHDYKVKDSMAIATKLRQDTLKYKPRKFKITDILTGYSLNNKAKTNYFSYSGILNKISYNSVQGYNTEASLNYTHYDTLNKKNLYVTTTFNYGISEEKFRPRASITKYLNKNQDQYILLSGGQQISQYNSNDPINSRVNAVASLVFTKNFAKYYHKDFATLTFGSKLTDFLNGVASISYQNRKALQNHNFLNPFKNNREYWSNNPLNIWNDDLAFNTNSLTKLSLQANFRFGNRYMKTPDRITTITTDKYPVIQLGYQNAFQSSIKNYSFQSIHAAVKYNVKMAQYGNLQTNTKFFSFLNQNKQLEFVDFHHFNGNQTYVYNLPLYNNHFFLLPYYSHSTQKSSINSHISYNDKGFIINKIPVLKLLQCNLIANYNFLTTTEHKPYMEYAVGLDNLGFGKYRIFKLQYTLTNQNTRGIQFGINTSLFNL